VILGALPLFHSFGQTCALERGGRVRSVPDPDRSRSIRRRSLDVIERDAVTVFEGVPTMYSALLAIPSAIASTRAACGVHLRRRRDARRGLRAFEEAFGCVILEGYGLSETSPAACFNHRDRPRKPGSIGTPIEGVAMRLVDDDGREVPAGEVGEVAIRGHNVMKGYWRRPEATAEVLSADGWFRTGDSGASTRTATSSSSTARRS
jgi:long-chain acyl-CoA synthetase